MSGGWSFYVSLIVIVNVGVIVGVGVISDGEGDVSRGP